MVGHASFVDQLRYNGEVLDLQTHCEVVECDDVHERTSERRSSAGLGEVRATVVVVKGQQLHESLIVVASGNLF